MRREVARARAALPPARNGSGGAGPVPYGPASFAVATVLSSRLGWAAGAPGFFLAGFVAASRIEADRHFTSDVVFGAALGTATALAVLDTRAAEAERKGRVPGPASAERRASRRRWRLTPFAVAGGGGLAVAGEW